MKIFSKIIKREQPMKSNFRWVIVGLVALATVINYIDRALAFT